MGLRDADERHRAGDGEVPLSRAAQPGPVLRRWLFGAAILGALTPLAFAFLWVPGLNVAALLLMKLAPLIAAAAYLIAGLRARRPWLVTALKAAAVGLTVALSSALAFWLLDTIG